MRLPAVALLLIGCGGAPGGPDSPDAAVGDGAITIDGAPDAMPVDESAALYDPAVVLQIELELPQPSLDALAADPTTYVPGTLRIGTTEVANIGVRLKGEYNFRPLGQKAAFKLKFDEFVPDQRFMGLRRMTLNAALEDASWVAERLTYHVYREAGLPAPRANLGWLTINGLAYGLYVNVETVDKTFLGRWFDDTNGNLYEEAMSDFTPGNEDGFELETNETANDRTDLVTLIDAVATSTPATFLDDVGGILDTEQFVRYCAYEAVVWQWDGYCFTRFGPNNFRVYHEPSVGKFAFLPWGMDMSWKPLEAGFDAFDARTVIFDKCLEAPGCMGAYRTALAAAADALAAQDLPALVDAWGAQARPFVINDPMREVSVDGFEATLTTVREVAAGRVDDLRAQLQP